MIPESSLKFNCANGIVVPRYLDERDHPWLRLLTEEYLRFVGATKQELLQHLRSPLPFSSPIGKRLLALHVLNGIFRSEVRAKISPRRLRARLFEAASTDRGPRAVTLHTVARSFDLSDHELEAQLFCDLPKEKRIVKPDDEFGPHVIALRANSLLIQSFMARAQSLTIKLTGNSRIVVRQAKLRGLICEVSEGSTRGNAVMTVSGPYTLFRRTLMYGRALAELLPQLAWCSHFHLRASCLVGEGESTLEVTSGDPIFPSKAPKQFDSKIEERFARGFLKVAKAWDLIREPQPIKAGDTLIFPDFILREKENPDNAWFLEIVGFWMPDYLQRKLALLKLANLENFILCVDSSLNCSDEEIPSDAHLVRFRRFIDPNVIKAIIERRINV